jgi:hypothetical protein
VGIFLLQGKNRQKNAILSFIVHLNKANMKKLYALLIATALLCTQISAQQVNTYTFSNGSGGTLDPMTGSTQLVGSSSDDGISAVTNIGFSFTYGGTAYTQFSANANGLIRLGPTAIASGLSGYSNSASNAGSNSPAIMTYWDDLATGTNGRVHFVLTGTAPNRILIVEWNVTVPRATSSAANARFQCWLYEGTNVIYQVYGNGMVANTGEASIGLATSSTVYNTVNTNLTTNTTSSFITTISNAIPSGQTYTWTPPAPCVGTPAAGTPEALTYNLCQGTTQVLNVTGAAVALGITYQWESSADSTSGWANVTGGTGATTTSYTTPAFSGTPIFYRLRTTCANGGASSTTHAISVTPPAAPITQANTITLSALGATTVTLNWINGNGNNRSVYINSTNSFTNPVTPASPGTPATAWANAGQQLVLDGTASTVTITGLTANTTYFVRVYESQKCTTPSNAWYYNTATATGNPISFTTPVVPVNDDCANALTLTPQPYVLPGTCPNPVSGTTLGANTSSVTAPPSAIFFSSQDDDVWYQFTATNTAHIVRFCNVTFPIGTPTSMGLVLNPGCTSGDLEIAGNPTGSLVTLTAGSGEMGFSGLTVGTLYKLRVLTNGTLARANFDISILQPGPLTYVSSTTTQVSTATVLPGSVNQQMIRLEVVTSGALGTLNVTDINFNTTGTTNPADILNARVFYTGTSTTFSTTTPFGTALANPNGSFTISGSQSLTGAVVGTATNYFWLVYDVACNATAANVLDAECTGVTIGATQIPTVTAPTGSRTVAAPAAPARTDGNGTTAIVIGTLNAPMVYVNVVAAASCPSTVTTVNFAVSGTSPAADITTAKCFYTTTTTFSTATPFGTAIATPSGAISFTGTQALATGNNYFWLVYDIACAATTTNTVNGDVTSIVVNGITQTPTGTATSANAITAGSGPFTIANGEWSNPAIWACGIVPTSATSAVVIGHNVTVSTAGNVAGDVTVNAGSSLTIQSGGQLTMGVSSAGAASGNSNRLLTVNGTLGLTGGTLNLNGGASITGSFNMSDGTLNVDPNDGTNAGSFANANGGFYIAQGTNTISVTGGAINFLDPMFTAASGTGQSVFGYSNSTLDAAFGTGCTVTFGGGDDQNAANVNGFYVESNLATGTLEFGNAIIAGGRFAAQRAVTSRQGTLNFITKFRNLTINNGAELVMTAGSSPVSITGNLVNNGIITNAAATTGSGLFFGDLQFSSSVLIFPLTSGQTVSGTGFFKKATGDADPTAATGNLIGGMTVSHLKTSAGVTFNVPITATNFIRLINGRVNTTSTNFLALGHGTSLPGNPVTLTATTGTLFGSSTTAPTSLATYLPAGWVNGSFNRWVTATTTSGQQGILPVGSVDTSRPAQINFTAAPTAGGYLLSQWFDNAGGINGLPLNEPAVTPGTISVVAPGFWQINKDATLTGGTYDVLARNNAAQFIINFANTVLLKRADAASPWALEGTHVATTGTNTVLTARRNGLTTFSEFAIGGATGVIPVRLEYFTGNKQGNDHRLDWKVTCTNSLFAILTIETSADGRTYTPIYTSRETALRCLQPFSFINTRALPGLNYYRLKMQDDQGVISYSSVVALLNKADGLQLVSISPNPVTDGRFNLNITAAVNQKLEIVVADMQGKIVSRRTVALTAGFTPVEMNMSQLSAGTYQVYGILGNEKTRTISFIKQ